MASKNKPVLPDHVSKKAQEPVIKRKPEKKRWVFSFRFWKQIEHFGLDRQLPSWFVSLLDKLAALSNEAIDDFLADQSKKDYWRYHEIDWARKNVPIQRKDLTWLRSDYLNRA